MYGNNLVFIIAIMLNGHQIIADETTITPETENSTSTITIAITESTPSSISVTEISNDNATEQPNIDTTPVETKIEIISTTETIEEIAKAESTATNESKNKKTTRSIHHTTERPAANSLVTQNNPEAPDAIKSIASSNEEPEAKTNRKFGIFNTEVQKSQPSFMGRLTGGLLFPALKARNTIGKGFLKSKQGVKDFGDGTFEAVSGAFTFLKDATKAAYNTG